MNKLQQLREKIDSIDDKILSLLQERVSIMRQIGEEKKKLHKPIRDETREMQKLEIIKKKTEGLALPMILVTNIWKLFFEISEEVEK